MADGKCPLTQLPVASTQLDRTVVLLGQAVKESLFGTTTKMAHGPIHFFFNVLSYKSVMIIFCLSRRKRTTLIKQAVTEPLVVNDTYVFLKAKCLDLLQLVAFDAKKTSGPALYVYINAYYHNEIQVICFD